MLYAIAVHFLTGTSEKSRVFSQLISIIHAVQIPAAEKASKSDTTWIESISS